MSIPERCCHTDRQAEDRLETGEERLRFAINFLRTNAGIEDESLLSSPMLIHAVAAVSRAKDNRLTASGATGAAALSCWWRTPRQ